MNQRRKRPSYTREFKQDAVKLVLEQGYTCGEVAQRLGIARSNVTRWVRLHQSDHPEFTESDVPRSELENEIRRLRRENQRLQMEREILKKAAAFFAKESN
jgi:transposase